MNHYGRVLGFYHIGTGGMAGVVVDAKLIFSAALVAKKIHSIDNGSEFLNTTNYEYNSRGWLKRQINPLLNLMLYYDDQTDSDLRQFNGNISGQSWGPQSNYKKNQINNEITVKNTDQKTDEGQNHLPIPELAETTQLVDPPKGKAKKSNLPDGEVHSINASFAFGGGYSV